MRENYKANRAKQNASSYCRAPLFHDSDRPFAAEVASKLLKAFAQ
jgi:hypothetical protein